MDGAAGEDVIREDSVCELIFILLFGNRMAII